MGIWILSSEVVATPCFGTGHVPISEPEGADAVHANANAAAAITSSTSSTTCTSTNARGPNSTNANGHQRTEQRVKLCVIWVSGCEYI